MHASVAQGCVSSELRSNGSRHAWLAHYRSRPRRLRATSMVDLQGLSIPFIPRPIEQIPLSLPHTGIRQSRGRSGRDRGCSSFLSRYEPRSATFGCYPAGGCPVPANRPILNSDRGIRTTSSLRTIRCQSNGQFRVTCHLTTVDRPLHRGGASHERRTRERFARFRGFNSVSTDPRSFAYARGSGRRSFQTFRGGRHPDRSGSTCPLLAPAPV